MATPTVKVNDIRAWQSSWNPVQTPPCVTKVEHEGEWRARVWRRRVKQVEVEPRGTVPPAVLLFCLRGFCSVRESNDHSLPSHSSVSTREVRKCLSSRSFPSTNFRLFSSLFSPLLPLLPGEPTYFNKVDLFPRMRLFRSFRALHGSKRFSQSPRCILELVILCV